MTQEERARKKGKKGKKGDKKSWDSSGKESIEERTDVTLTKW